MAFSSFESLPDDARVWIYRSNRPFGEEEKVKINSWLVQFIGQWTAHNVSLLANAQIFHDQFIVISLDESGSTSASGCSIDSQVRFITKIGQEINVDLFDRLTFDFHIDGKVVSVPKDEVKGLISSGTLKKNSPVFDHLIKTKADLKSNWIVSLESSWHSKLI